MTPTSSLHGRDPAVAEPATVRRTDPSALAAKDCLLLLANHHVPVGRVAFVHDGRPAIVPVNFRVDGHGVVFRSEAGGLLHRQLGQPVAFEATWVEPGRGSGWAVVFHGRLREVEDVAELLPLTRLALRPWAPGSRNRYLRLDASEIHGRRLDSEAPLAP